MAVPNAPTDLGGTKVMFLLWDNGGENEAAFLRGVGRQLVNGESVAHLAVATHMDGESFDASDQVVAIGAVNEGVVRKVVADASGRLVLRPALAYDGGAVPAFAHQRAIGQAALEGEDAAHAGVATHLDGGAFAASEPVVVAAGVHDAAAKRLVADAQGRLIVAAEASFGGAGHKNVIATGTAVPLRASTLPCRRVRVKADAANSGPVYLGASAVTSNEVEATGGYQLEAGDWTDVDVTDVMSLFINGTAADGVSYLYWT
jgi:hypothetical protein